MEATASVDLGSSFPRGGVHMVGIECAFFDALTRDADARTSKNGKQFVLLNVVVGDGDARQFVSVIVFGDAAGEVAALEKGRRVYVEGRVEINEWTSNDGAKRAGLKVVSFNAWEVSKIGRRKDRKPSSPTAALQQEQGNNFHDDEVPF
jgi:single-stranded DNA-binding protein